MLGKTVEDNAEFFEVGGAIQHHEERLPCSVEIVESKLKNSKRGRTLGEPECFEKTKSLVHVDILTASFSLIIVWTCYVADFHEKYGAVQGAESLEIAWGE